MSQLKQLNSVEFAIYGEYYHFWYIPVFPFEKDGHAKCSHCDFRINSLKYNKLTLEDFKDVKKKFKYPFYTFTGAAIFFFPILVAIVLALLP